MRYTAQNLSVLPALLWSLSLSGVAIAAPGEDPITLNEPVQYMALPTAAPQRSGGLDGNPDAPAWSRAKMSRYQAKAFSATADDGTIFTDSDVVTTVQQDGFKTTCVQEVGSVTGEVPLGSKYGPNQREQVVVLRGDLVNICK